MATVSMGVLLATIDGSIVNVALPTMKEVFGASFNVIQWVALGYMLTLATFTLGVGRLGDVVGKKTIYTAGFGVFTAASVLCGLAPTVELLIAFRVLQAIGATMTLALGASILVEAFPHHERGKALGLIGTAVSLGVITGPVVGGLLIASFNWQAIFFVNIPVGIIGTWLAIRHVPNTAPTPGQTMDYRGAALMSGSLLSLSLALTLGQSLGFGSPLILTLFVAALVGAAAFVRLELRVESPMVNLRLFKNPMLSVSVISGFATFVTTSATFFLLPFYLEGVLDLPIRQVGLMLGAAPLVLGVVAPISGWLSDRIGIRKLTFAGLLFLTAGYASFRTFDTDTTVAHYLVIAAVIGIGLGVFQSPNNSAIMGSVPREYSGVASGLLTLTRLLGQITGVAVLGTLWATRVLANGGTGGDATAAPEAAQVAGLWDTFTVGAALIAVAALVGVWALRRESTELDQAVSIP